MNDEDTSTQHGNSSVSVVTALGLRPLDRVQVANAWEFEQMRNDQHFHGAGELPFFFFQRVIDGELIEVRNPAGRTAVVSPLDICDVRPATPLIVQAMSQPEFLEWLRCPPAKRVAAAPEAFAPAYVLYASKSLAGSLQAHVWFVDPALNVTGRPWAAPLIDSDRRTFEAAARQTVMPVVKSRGSGFYSADAGCARDENRSRSAADAFFASALAGDVASVAKLSSIDLKAPSRRRTGASQSNAL